VNRYHVRGVSENELNVLSLTPVSGPWGRSSFLVPKLRQPQTGLSQLAKKEAEVNGTDSGVLRRLDLLVEFRNNCTRRRGGNVVGPLSELNLSVGV